MPLSLPVVIGIRSYFLDTLVNTDLLFILFTCLWYFFIFIGRKLTTYLYKCTVHNILWTFETLDNKTKSLIVNGLLWE